MTGLDGALLFPPVAGGTASSRTNLMLSLSLSLSRPTTTSPWGVASGVTAAAELVEGGGLEAVRCGVCQSLARVLLEKGVSIRGTCPPRPPWDARGRGGGGAGSMISGSEYLTIVFSALILRYPLRLRSKWSGLLEGSLRGPLFLQGAWAMDRVAVFS